MSTYEDRIKELGLTLPEVAAPVAAYTPAVISNNLVYTSGQLPLAEGKLLATGVVSENSGENTVDPQQGAELAARCALNAIAAVKSVIGDLQRITRVVKVNGFVASAPDFYGQPGVVDGASKLLGEIFGDVGLHARAAVGVAALPLNAPVEVELIVEFS